MFKQNRTTLKPIFIGRTLTLFFTIALFCLVGCDRLQTSVTSTDLVEKPASMPSIKIGFIYSPPDPGTTRNGAELAVALANEDGGIKGAPIHLLVRDDKKISAYSVQHAEELIDLGVSAIVGPDYSTIAMEVSKVIREHEIPMLTTYPTNPRVPENSDFVFMAAYTDPYQANIMANFAIQELNAATAATLTEINSSYSQGLTEVFVEAFTAEGGTVAIRQLYEAGTTDYTEQLTAIAAVDPPVDVIFLPGLGPEFPLAVKQARDTHIGITATFLGGDGWDRPDLADIAGEAVNGSFFVDHFSPDGTAEQSGERARLFINAYTERFGMPPDGPAALGYDAVNILIAAMKRTSQLTPVSIRDQIQVTQNYKGATILVYFDENRHAIKGAVINTIMDKNIRFHRSIEP